VITPTTDLRLRVAQIIGDLGALITHCDTIDEIDRNPSPHSNDVEVIMAELGDAHFTADVLVGRAIELSKATEQLTITKKKKGRR
jgi:hypothetical protein